MNAASTFVGLGMGFDVASMQEIEMCLKAGAKPESLIWRFE